MSHTLVSGFIGQRGLTSELVAMIVDDDVHVVKGLPDQEHRVLYSWKIWWGL